MRRDPVALLDRRLRLDPGCRYDADQAALWVRRRGRVERLIAWVAHRGASRVRLNLDARSAAVVAALHEAGPLSGRELAARVGIPADDDAVERRDEDLAALLVFLATLWRAGVLVTEPI